MYSVHVFFSSLATFCDTSPLTSSFSSLLSPALTCPYLHPSCSLIFTCPRFFLASCKSANPDNLSTSLVCLFPRFCFFKVAEVPPFLSFLNHRVSFLNHILLSRSSPCVNLVLYGGSASLCRIDFLNDETLPFFPFQSDDSLFFFFSFFFFFFFFFFLFLLLSFLSFFSFFFFVLI